MRLEAVRSSPFRYAGKDQKQGDVFEASDKDGALFKKLNWAADAGLNKNSTDIPEMGRASRVEPLTEDPFEEIREMPAEAVEDEAPKPKRRYIRRDMRADDDPD